MKEVSLYLSIIIQQRSDSLCKQMTEDVFLFSVNEIHFTIFSGKQSNAALPIKRL